ncbi:MAG: LD-carboxypeptidase [Acidobacteria bacterium]|nr:LD-carboxypeptidase [Acidobacteriota bacterium]
MSMLDLPRLPPPVRPGDRVGVAALSGPVQPDRLERGLAALAGLGFEPVPADNLGDRYGLFAGSDEQRLTAFHRLAADPSIKAIVFARGGHGVLRLLPHIDWALLGAHPRAYVGYSDLTPFLLEVVRRLGLVAFHGAMVAADLARGQDADEEQTFLACLAGEPPARYDLPSWPRPGVAEGPLLGGCLSLLVATLGTRFAPPLSGAILLWEEVEEPLYRLDRMLTHLHLSGRLPELAGMVVGHISWTRGEKNPGLAWQQLVELALSSVPGPLAAGLSCGHRAPNLTLPLGVRVRMDPETRSLVLLQGLRR